MKLLLAEDNPADARLVREMLSEAPGAPFELLQVNRLEAAIERMQGEPVDEVLLDLGLPDSQGMGTLVRMQQANAAVPIVVLTGLNDQRFAEEILRAGAQDYLVKGNFSSELLVRTIRYAAERKHAEQALVRSHEELTRFNQMAVGRELRIVELKQQVNALSAELGRKVPYPLEFLATEESRPDAAAATDRPAPGAPPTA